jgi:hypothetical protein
MCRYVMALAAKQGHAYAMIWLGGIHFERKVGRCRLNPEMKRTWECFTSGRVGRFRYIAWVKCPYRVAAKASALRAGKLAPGAQIECPYRVAGKASALGAGSDIPKSAYFVTLHDPS